MSLRPPPLDAASRPYVPTRADLVIEDLLRRGPVVDESTLRAVFHDDPVAVRYARNVLNMLAQLGQLDHVRRGLWIERLLPHDPRRPYALLATAARALGSYVVAAGTWALELHGICLRHLDHAACVRFVLTPERARPSTYSTVTPEQVAALPLGANEYRHVTSILEQPIAAVLRPAARIGCARWIGTGSLGGHVLDIEDAFISLLECPRLSGGYDTAALAALPVLARVGPDALLRAGRSHPTLAVRRRLAFTLFHAVERTTEAVTWIGAACRWTDVDYQRWRIPRELDVFRERGQPTVLEPHRARIGSLDRELAVFDNRGAPLLARRPRGVRFVRDAGDDARRSHGNRSGS